MGVHVRRFLGLAVAFALVMSVAGCTGTKTQAVKPASSEPIRVGVVLSLTGPYAALGTAEKNALELESDALNRAGGIDGRKIELVIEDDGTDEAKAVAATTKLIDQDKVVAIIGASGTGQSMAMRGDVDRAGIAQISMAGGTVITSTFDSLVYQTPWSNTIVVPYVLQAIKDAGYAKIALLADTGGYGKDGSAVIKSDAGEFGIKIVDSQTFNPGDTDLSAQLTKIKSSGAEAVLLWTAGKEGALAVKGARDLGITVPFFGGSGQARKEFIDGAGPAAEGLVFGTGKSLVPANWGKESKEYATLNDFAVRYEAAYGNTPDIFAGHAFDAFNIVVGALKSAGPDADAAAVAKAVEGTKGLIGFGGTFTFSATDHNGLTEKDLALYRITDGAWKTIK